MHKRKQIMRPTPRFVLAVCILVVSVVILASTVAWWLTPKACDHVPPSLSPRLTLVQQNGDVRHEYHSTDRQVLACLADDLDHLPKLPTGTLHCPKSDGSTFIVQFESDKLVSGTTSGCGIIKVQGDPQLYWLAKHTIYTQDFREQLKKIPPR